MSHAQPLLVLLLGEEAVMYECRVSMPKPLLASSKGKRKLPSIS